MGHERRPLRQAAARQLPLCPVSGRSRVAVQYVAKCHKQTHALQQIEGPQLPNLRHGGYNNFPFHSCRLGPIFMSSL
jgi:hypothetical protein